ncbi:hypothetical protein [Psychrobacter aestuarii]|uniref:Uncharacterized protein n=1 Tax=Psychrobacter aestuarii TaxID=556327 RepID=A0ABP3F841_9GAMM|nr:hypothetical protein [Psychrobacter aestuarii]
MNLFKQTFHSDPNIRYAREIKKGTIHVKKRADTYKWHYYCWCLRVSLKGIKNFWLIFVMVTILALKAWIYWLTAQEGWVYFEGMPRERRLHLLLILPFTLSLWAVLIACMFMGKNELKRLKAWHVQVAFSNRNYIVAKRCDPKLVKYRRLMIQLSIVGASLACIYTMVTFDWMLLLSDG